jgi:hypothetical protein
MATVLAYWLGNAKGQLRTRHKNQQSSVLSLGSNAETAYATTPTDRSWGTRLISNDVFLECFGKLWTYHHRRTDSSDEQLQPAGI